MPGLDGLRAPAVLAVLAYHLDLGWASGGLLGVGVFFTLRGFLITDLLREEWVRGGIDLGRFWLRRARRLLPALFVILVVGAAWVTLLRPAEVEALRGRGRGLGDAPAPGGARAAARRGRVGSDLRQPLVADLLRRSVRGPLRPAVA